MVAGKPPTKFNKKCVKKRNKIVEDYDVNGAEYSKADKLSGEDLHSAKTILNLTADVIKETNRRIDLLLTIKKRSSDNAAFEIGYLMYIIQEKYRRMVDKYNTSHYMRRRLYLMELVLYLEEIEQHYWEIDHLSKMLHEIERKYKIETELDEEYKEIIQTSIQHGTIPKEYLAWPTKRTKKRKRFKWNRYLMSRYFSTKKQHTRWWWPIEYGWEIDYYW